MDAVKVISLDIDFLIEQFQAIKHERKFEVDDPPKIAGRYTKDRQIENLKAIIKVQEELLESFKDIIKGK